MKLTKRNSIAASGYALAFFFLIFLLRDVVRIIMYSNRGLDLTDEAFYALSYATREEVGRSFTGATWLIGSLYDLLGHNIARLRIAKVILLISTGALLGDQIFRWICDFHRKYKNASYSVSEKTGWHLAIIFGAALSALFPYSWTPATPNYNDLNLIILLTLASILVALVRNYDNDIKKIHFVLFGLTGFLLAMQSFAKSSSALATCLLILPIYLSYFVSVKNFFKILASSLVGFISFWIFSQLFIADVINVVPESLALLKIIAKDGYDPATLISGYMKQIYSHVRIMIENYWMLIIFCLATPFISKKLNNGINALFVIFFTLAVFRIYMNSTYLSGGPVAIVTKGQFFTASLVIISIVLVLGDLLSRFGDNKSPKDAQTLNTSKTHILFWIPNKISEYPLISVIWVLLFLPFVQALGTLNSIFTGATFSNISWVLLIVVLAACATQRVFTQYALYAVVLLSIIGIRQITVDGFTNQPYRLLAATEKNNISVDGLDRIKELKFDVKGAKYFTELRKLRDENNIKDGSTILGFWDLPGEIYALGGISPGEPWYIGGSINRNIANIKYSCEQKQISDKNKPIILISGTVPMEISNELTNCGIDFENDYTKVGQVLSPYTNRNTELYVPNSPK